MEKQEALDKYADLIANEDTVEAYFNDGVLFYLHKGLNTVEMMEEIVRYKLDGENELPGTVVMLGPFEKAKKKGEKIK